MVATNGDGEGSGDCGRVVIEISGVSKSRLHGAPVAACVFVLFQLQIRQEATI